MVLNGGQLGIVWLDPSVTGGSALPTSLVHQVKLTFATAPSPLIPAELTESVAATAVRATPAPTIQSPLDGPNWFDGNGCCDEVTPHRGASNPINGRYDFAERFAIDWVQLTPELTLTTGAPTELSSYAYYGAPIHAVADGEIVAVFDELQDQVPGANPPEGSLTLDQYSGNHVVQRFEQNGQTYYALYAHLKPGTAKAAVTVGQNVSAGDVLGELGNSGNTDAPASALPCHGRPRPAGQQRSAVSIRQPAVGGPGQWGRRPRAVVHRAATHPGTGWPERRAHERDAAVSRPGQSDRGGIVNDRIAIIRQRRRRLRRAKAGRSLEQKGVDRLR